MTAAPAEPKRMARKRTPTKAEDDSPGARLRRLVNRKARNRTDAEIAEAVGMTRHSFSRLLTSTDADPKLSTITAILDEIGATLAEFERA